MDENPYKAPHAARVPSRHSWVGIASFAIALAAALIEAVMLPLTVYMAHSGVSNKSSLAIFAMLVVVGGVLLDVLSFGLGVIALFLGNRKRLFAALGATISRERCGDCQIMIEYTTFELALFRTLSVWPLQRD